LQFEIAEMVRGNLMQRLKAQVLCGRIQSAQENTCNKKTGSNRRMEEIV